MDEVWMVSLCLTFFAFVVAFLSLKKSDGTRESSAKGKEQRSPEPVTSSPQPAARYMELTLEDIEKSLERLGAVLGMESPGVKAPASDSDSHSLSGTEEQPYQRGGMGAASRGWAERRGGEAWSHPERQDRVVKALPLPKLELANQLFATEDWEFEDEEICAFQCEGAGKQYYHLYWDEESLPDRSSKSVVERTELNRRKVNHDQQVYMETRESDRTCSALLQSGSNPLYLQDPGKQPMTGQLGTTLVRFHSSEQIDNDKLESCTAKEFDPISSQLVNELLSLQSTSGDKSSETDPELNLNLCTDRQTGHESENQISSWTDRNTDEDGSLYFEEFSLLRSKLQIRHRGSDSENSSMDSCLPSFPGLDKWPSVPLSLSHYLERDDTSSTDDISSSPANSRESRFTSHDESSSSDSSLLSFWNDTSLSESNTKSADCRDSRNIIAKLRTDLVTKVPETDKALWPLPISEPPVVKLNASSEMLVSGDLPNILTETARNNHVRSGSKCEICSCASSSEKQPPNSLYTLQSTAFYTGEPNTAEELLNVESANYQRNIEDSGEPVKWRLEKKCGLKQVKNDDSVVHYLSHCEDPRKWQDSTLWETRSLQQLWPECEQGKEIQAHPPAATATQNIMEQIEQAVQETPDHNRERSEFIRIRLAPPAPQLETPPRDDVLQYKHPYSSD
ncbi:uncharacterized protein LOC119978556 isoform X2 [Scyliorhinus canicula]|uniref:uncharacterized protein LOC119978556 isoform X2 n=1 Tax=Scyliorhinus canicula TaxID=7830 RepID=UPI0018F4855A|nr:uncharacterized protein LOC119978556 isoform X2 [Scyliorhinus canicula]